MMRFSAANSSTDLDTTAYLGSYDFLSFTDFLWASAHLW
jgi:hypothetical protein